MDIDEFIKKNSTEKSARSSVLKPYQNDIFRLKEEGFSGSKILEYLTLNGVKVTLTSLNRYIQRNYKAPTVKGRAVTSQPSESLNKPAKATSPAVEPVAVPVPKPRDPTKPSWVSDHIDIDALLSKD